MEKKIVVYLYNISLELICSAAPEIGILSIDSKFELAVSIIEEKNIICTLIQEEVIDGSFIQFLISLKNTFPLIHIGIISKKENKVLSDIGCDIIKFNENDKELIKTISQFVSSIKQTNRRKNHRFKWPLVGYISWDDKENKRMNVRSLSASGAFLESSSILPKPGTKARIQIEFKNFKMSTECEILDPREASSTFPTGFGVRFTSLSNASKTVIDKIVNDALINVLFNPEMDIEIPSISEDDLLSDQFDLL